MGEIEGQVVCLAAGAGLLNFPSEVKVTNLSGQDGEKEGIINLCAIQGSKSNVTSWRRLTINPSNPCT